MKPQKKSVVNMAKSIIEESPDKTKCDRQESKKLPGPAPGDRGMCEKRGSVQGSEYAS
jgi:hypothetical protein